MMYCPNCGKKIKSDSAFCPYCGANFSKLNRKLKSSSSRESDSRNYSPIQKGPTNYGSHNRSHKKLWVIVIVIVVIILGLFGFCHHNESANNNQKSNVTNSSSSSDNGQSDTRYINLKVHGYPGATVYINGKPRGTIGANGKGVVHHVKTTKNEQQTIDSKYKSFPSNQIDTNLSNTATYDFGLPNYIPKSVHSKDYKYVFSSCPEMKDSTTVDGFFAKMGFAVGLLSTKGEVPHQIPSKNKGFRRYFDLNNRSAKSGYDYMVNVMDKYHSKPEHSCEVTDGGGASVDPKNLRIQYKNNRTYVSFENVISISYEGKTTIQQLHTKWNFQLKRINGVVKIVAAQHGRTISKARSDQSVNWHGHNIFKVNDHSKMFDGLKNSGI